MPRLGMFRLGPRLRTLTAWPERHPTLKRSGVSDQRKLELRTNQYVRIWKETERSLVYMVRTAVLLPQSREGLVEFYEDIVASMSGIDRASHDLLVDSREATGRNDEVFEQVQDRYRQALFGDFRRIAVVLRTLAGRLQVSRYQRSQTAVRSASFGTIEDALEFLDAA